MAEPETSARDDRPRLGLVALLALLALVGVAALVLALALPDSETRRAPAAPGLRAGRLPDGLHGRPAPRIALRAARGGVIDTAQLRGRPYAVTFLYTQCPDVCPLIGQELRESLERLGRDADRTTVIAVSVDPKGDTPGAVRAWLRRQREPASFRYAIGTQRALAPVWKAYYAAPQVPGRPESSHSAAIWLIDARGRLRAHIAAGVPVRPADLAHDLRVLLRESGV